MGIIDDITGGISSGLSDAWDATKSGLSDAWHATESGFSDAASWAGAHWETIAIVGGGIVLAVVSGGLAVPVLAAVGVDGALATVGAVGVGGFVGGGGSSVISQLLKGRSLDPWQVLENAALTGAISAGSFGLAKVVTPFVPSLLPAPLARIAGLATDAAPAAPSEAASAFANLDPQTAKILADYGIDPTTALYRVTSPRYVDLENMLAPGNPSSMALVRDPYNPIALPSPDGTQPPLLIPGEVNASELGPTLNVSKVDPSGYAKAGDVKIELSAGDVIANGGRFYIDPTTLGGSYIVTAPSPIPVAAITRVGADEGLPLPAVGAAPDRERYVGLAIRAGGQSARALTDPLGTNARPPAPTPPSETEGLLGAIKRATGR
jgi:hypothetical protein